MIILTRLTGDRLLGPDRQVSQHKCVNVRQDVMPNVNLLLGFNRDTVVIRKSYMANSSTANLELLFLTFTDK